MNIQEYWAEVRRTEQSISAASVLVISLEKPKLGMRGGQIFAVSRLAAAKLLVAETHRLCTREEIAAYLAAQQAAQEEAAAREAARDLFVHSMPELAHRVVAKPPPVDGQKK